MRAKVARDVIPRELRKAGAQVDVVEAYETVAAKVISEAPARRAGGQAQAARHHLYQFFDGQEFRETCWDCAARGRR